MKLKPERWLKTLIDTPYSTLTKLDIYQYYKGVENKIKEHLTPRVIIRQTFEKGKTILRRHPGTRRYITIDPKIKDVNNKKSFDFWIERRATEFHKVFGKKTDELVIDIDPHESVNFETTKEVTKNLAEYLKDRYRTIPKIQYSGGKGFYIILKLKKKIPINQARKMLRKELLPITEKINFLTLKKPAKGQIRLDITILKENGSYRMPYSLNANTGLVSVFVPLNKLMAFDPKRDANPKKFINRKAIPKRLTG